MIRMLSDKLPFARPTAVTGKESFTQQVRHPVSVVFSRLKQSRQQEVFANFADGKYNLLVATRTLEDLGIPQALVVIR